MAQLLGQEALQNLTLANTALNVGESTHELIQRIKSVKQKYQNAQDKKIHESQVKHARLKHATEQAELKRDAQLLKNRRQQGLKNKAELKKYQQKLQISKNSKKIQRKSMPAKRKSRSKSRMARSRSRTGSNKKKLFQYRKKSYRRRSGAYRKTKFQSKVHKRLNKFNKYASTNVNQVYPQKGACILNYRASSYTNPSCLFFPDIKNLLFSDNTGTKRTSYSRQLVLNSTNFLIDSGMGQSVNEKYPVDKQQPLKLSPYKKMRINGCTVTVTFQIFGTFDGHVWALPGIIGTKASDQMGIEGQNTGNCTTNGYYGTNNTPNTIIWTGPTCQFHEGVQDQWKLLDNGTYQGFGNNPGPTNGVYKTGVYGMQPAITEENMHLQKSIKFKKIVRQSYGGGSAPKTYSFKFKLKFRDMDLTLKNQDDYNEKYKFYEIQSSEENGYTFPRIWGTSGLNGNSYANQQFNLAFGILPSVAQTTPVYARASVRMKQFVELAEPFRQKYGTNHPIV